MNYLAHLHLGGPAPQQLLGSLYGDFVKGTLEGASAHAGSRDPLASAYRQLHRQPSRGAGGAGAFSAGTAAFCRHRPDVFFDHCLARHWSDYAQQPLAQFTDAFYKVLLAEPVLPGRLARIAPFMAEDDWLGAYGDFATLEQVFGGIARRLSRPEGMAGVMPELERLYEPLLGDFREFYPQLQAFAAAGRKD